jgi:hypothetical protein
MNHPIIVGIISQAVFVRQSGPSSKHAEPTTREALIRHDYRAKLDRELVRGNPPMGVATHNFGRRAALDTARQAPSLARSVKLGDTRRVRYHALE